ncbi:Carbonyl reductase [NADPH] 3 [Lemmus lemmus]
MPRPLGGGIKDAPAHCAHAGFSDQQPLEKPCLVLCPATSCSEFAQVRCFPTLLYTHPAMSSCSRVALVTGANKGIGFAITRDLCRKFSGDVVLTARDEARGKAAVKQLQAEGLSPRFHQLDIDDLQSIRALRDFLLKEYGGLDVLVNNAGIAFKSKPWGVERAGAFPSGAMVDSASQGSIARAGTVCPGSL